MRSKKLLLSLSILLISGCASSYKTIDPPGLTYLSNSSDQSVSLDYKFNLLPKKYAKKEIKNNIRLVAVKLTNNSGKDLVFGKDIKLTYGNGTEVSLIDNEQVFAELRQQTPLYLLYLLLTPATLTTTSGDQSSSIPIGYGLGPGLAAINVITASSANGKFKEELMNYKIMGATIKSGATVYGLVGINSASFESLKLKVQ